MLGLLYASFADYILKFTISFLKNVYWKPSKIGIILLLEKIHTQSIKPRERTSYEKKDIFWDKHFIITLYFELQ